MKENTITITNDSGVEFTARLLQKGQKYGLDDKLTWDRETPVVEYYLPEHKIHGPRGYFIGSWDVEIVLGHTPGAGHLLDGGNTELVLSARNVEAVQDFIRTELPEYEGQVI